MAAAVPLLALAGCGSSTSTTSASGSSSASSTAGTPPGAFAGKKATGTPVKIGLINPEGGPTVSEPEDRLAAQAAADYANANLGGLGGHPITLDVCKEQEDTASARACANQMVQDGVVAVVVTTTGQGDSIAPIVTKAGIPYVSVSGESASELTSPDAFMWSGGFPATLVGMAKYSATHGIKSVAAFVSGVPSAVGGAQAFGAPAFKAAGVGFNVVPIPPGTADATSQVTAALKGNPGGLIVVGDDTLCTSLIKAFATVGATGKQMLIQPCLDPSTVQAVGSSMNGSVVFTDADTSSNDPEAVLYRDVMAKWAPGAPTQGYAVTGYQGLLGLVRATQSLSGAVTPSSVATAIKGATNVALPAGHGLTFTCDGKALPGLTAVCSAGSIIETVQNGKPTDQTVQS